MSYLGGGNVRRGEMSIYLARQGKRPRGEMSPYRCECVHPYIAGRYKNLRPVSLKITPSFT